MNYIIFNCKLEGVIIIKRCFFIICILILFSVTACSNSSNNSNSSDQSNETNITADIVKSGIVNEASYTDGLNTIELVSWDLGYSGHILTKGEEVLCVKFHIKNGTEEQHNISDIFSPVFFINGVGNSYFVSDFYGDGHTFDVYYGSELRAGAEADIYYCVNCNVSESYKIEVDLMELEEQDGYTFLTDNILTTFSFEIE